MAVIDDSLESLRREAAELRRQLARRLVSQGKARRARLLHYPDLRELFVAFPVVPQAERGERPAATSSPLPEARPPSSAGGVSISVGPSRAARPTHPPARFAGRGVRHVDSGGNRAVATRLEILPCRECGAATFVGETAPGTFALFDAVGCERGPGYRLVAGSGRPAPALVPATGAGTRFTLHWPACPRLSPPRRDDGRAVVGDDRALREVRQAAAPPISRSSFCRTRSGSTTGLAR